MVLVFQNCAGWVLICPSLSLLPSWGSGQYSAWALGDTVPGVSISQASIVRGPWETQFPGLVFRAPPVLFAVFGCSIAEGKMGREAPFPLLLLAALPLPRPPPGLSNLGMDPGITCDCLFPASSAGRRLLLFLPPNPHIWNELHRVSAVEWSLHGMGGPPYWLCPCSAPLEAFSLVSS